MASMLTCESRHGDFNYRFFYHFHIWSQFWNKYCLWKCQCICLPRKNFLNLQVEFILGIISIIILSSLIDLNCSIIIPSESSTRQIALACSFPKVDSVFMFDFLFNIIWFILISFRHQSLKKDVFDIVQWPNCIKLLFERVWCKKGGDALVLFWWEICLILFWVILRTPGIHMHMYCNYLLTTKVTALQDSPSYFPLPPMVLTLSTCQW